ncbi:hypothetical protein FQA39_LY01672 [Lamprigera yunnana]|nr:hypothetical protein FQA39_LY01672 [Lamprigera yunnana]
MLKYFPLILIGLSVAEINKCTNNLQCIPLSECDEIIGLVHSDDLLDYVQSLSCGYFHEPYICCARDCKTPNGNRGRLKIYKECPSLKQNEHLNNENKKQFLKDSFINETHVCCGYKEDEYKSVPAPPDDEQSDLSNLTCVTPNGDYAKCTQINDCPSYIEAAAEPNEYFKFINDSFCGYWKEPMVCCGDFSYYKETYADNLPENSRCGSWNVTFNKKIQPPPWLVLISTNEFLDVCIGALINHQYVLSTVVCTERQYKKLKIKFGACIDNGNIKETCIANVIQIKIFPLQNFIRSTDTGVVLLKLDRSVPTHILPICLSQVQLPILQEVKIVGMSMLKRHTIVDKVVPGETIFTDDCYFGRNSACVTPNRGNGRCIPVRSCTPILNALESGSNEAIRLAQQSQCGYDSVPLVCCAETPTAQDAEIFSHRLLPSTTTCGIQNLNERIVGGDRTDIDEFPWLALLGYRDSFGDDAGFRCGGSLINERYILTAAHCTIVNSNLGVSLEFVRLGEWRLSTGTDCLGQGRVQKCAGPAVDINVETTIPHQNYNIRTRDNDIALVRMRRSVTFNDFIRPICLPPPNAANPTQGLNMLVAGWGSTENESTSDIKLKVAVPIVASADCAKKIGRRGFITDNQLCAGGVQGKDSCQGDSGGPLMKYLERSPDIQWVQEGVISWGIGCGLVGYPGIYTKVSKYSTWIVNNMVDF